MSFSLQFFLPYNMILFKLSLVRFLAVFVYGKIINNADSSKLNLINICVSSLICYVFWLQVGCGLFFFCCFVGHLIRSGYIDTYQLWINWITVLCYLLCSKLHDAFRWRSSKNPFCFAKEPLIWDINTKIKS